MKTLQRDKGFASATPRCFTGSGKDRALQVIGDHNPLRPSGPGAFRQFLAPGARA